MNIEFPLFAQIFSYFNNKNGDFCHKIDRKYKTSHKRTKFIEIKWRKKTIQHFSESICRIRKVVNSIVQSIVSDFGKISWKFKNFFLFYAIEQRYFRFKALALQYKKEWSHEMLFILSRNSFSSHKTWL
jgi:hypothetical protein